MKCQGIYKITCKINNKCYIGSSSDIQKRLNSHKSLLKRNKSHSKHLQAAWNKYGSENFTFELIDTVNDISHLLAVEETYIKYYKSNNKDFGYNSKLYVDSSRGWKHSEETKFKMSMQRKGTNHGWLGRKHSEESKLKMSITRRRK